MNNMSADLVDAAKELYVRPYYNSRSKKTLSWMSQEPGNPLVIGHIYDALQQQGFHMSIERDNKSVYDQNKIWEALGKYNRRVKFSPNEVSFQRAVDLTFKEFASDGVILQPLQTKGEFLRALKLEKASGSPMFTNKKEAFDTDWDRAYRVVQGTKAPEPCVAARRIQHGATGPKVRLVWSYPLSMTMIEATFAAPLIKHFLIKQSAMAFGLHRFELAGRLVKVSNASNRLCLDYSSFDSSLVPRMINMAFNVIATYFNFDEDDILRKVWDLIVRYFIHTPIVMPDSNIYVKHKGVPSGSYFTQIIDSICNYFILMYLSIEMDFTYIKGSVNVLGDDSAGGISKGISLTKARTVLSDLGITLNVEKSSLTHFGEVYDFLGHGWELGLVTREPEETAKRLAFPERPKDRSIDPRDYIAGRMYESLVDSKRAWLIYKRWLRGKHPNLLMAMKPRTVDVNDVFGWQRVQTISDDDPNWRFKHTMNKGYAGILT